ncbi:glycosyltransferase [Echinicola sp. 20G]|uniref:glycosyltransferase n=1 Tax=Echinicola sp. 20G TaxID=2781961 RepID=UPI00190FCE73|nr:glycosyltransferase [Echinicola sp. 20G]
MKTPLVSVIVVCYNQADFIMEALDSVRLQYYEQLEMIIVDNGSSDGSQEKIKTWLWMYGKEKSVPVFFHSQSINYCKAFNEALEITKGQYVIDLSGDDYLMPDHVEKSVFKLVNHQQVAVCSSNALLVDQKGKQIDSFFPMSVDGSTMGKVPEGDIYETVIRKYFVCTPTMVFDAKILKREGGYNEELVYEDFDVITRLSRKHSFIFSDHLGVRKRLHHQSFSKQQYKRYQSDILKSTFKVCQNIAIMNKSAEERHALIFRCMHEAKHALASANFEVAYRFLDLAEKLGASGIALKLYKLWHGTKLDLSHWYEKIRDR